MLSLNQITLLLHGRDDIKSHRSGSDYKYLFFRVCFPHKADKIALFHFTLRLGEFCRTNKFVWWKSGLFSNFFI